MKTILAAVVLFVMSNAAQAQLVKFGIKGRVNYANLEGSNIQTDAITISRWPSCRSQTNRRFFVQPELYSTQGATYNAGTEFKNELGTCSIPVLAKKF
jgi:hypothetical protein